MTAPATPTSNHPFERAELGVAPFRCVRVEYRIGPIRTVLANGVTQEIGSPGQPMGTCAYCFQGIAECCVIRDANGKEFIVGNQCVAKAARDYGQSSQLERDRKAALREARHERERTVALETRWRLEHDAELRALLVATPHPLKFDGKSMLDWALWMMNASGMAGRTKVRRAIDKMLAEVAA